MVGDRGDQRRVVRVHVRVGRETDPQPVPSGGLQVRAGVPARVRDQRQALGHLRHIPAVAEALIRDRPDAGHRIPSGWSPRSLREGTRIFYRLAGDDVAALYRALREVARTRLPDAGAARAAYLGSDESAEPVSRGELLRRARAGEVLVLDVRPAAEYSAGHIPGAVSVPLGDLPAQLGALPASTEIVAYCRGAYCVLARDAVRQLRASGLAARHLAEGMVEWRLDGLPVDAA